MLDHIGVDVADIRTSRDFYEAALKPLGYRVIEELTPEQTGANHIVMFGIDAPEFVIAEDKAPGIGNHIAFRADTRAVVDAFYVEALKAGGRDNGPPGLRPDYGPTYYAAFVFDPDGFNIEAVCHAPD
ncbi:MAG: VOC family protein [Alphaproteobacteria bacterium]|nr:VOC family protein [Alphaproteobacteria bacterium]MBU2378531.1 VOC family protein [Alphaproteobacteria bacterium]